MAEDKKRQRPLTLALIVSVMKETKIEIKNIS
jgi:hypothetical protein